MRAEILSIGSELTSGQSLDTNSQWLSRRLAEALPEGQPLPNLADLLQDKCEKLLEQVCMPVQG